MAVSPLFYMDEGELALPFEILTDIKRKLLRSIAAYCFFEKKPAIDVKFVNDGQLAMF